MAHILYGDSDEWELDDNDQDIRGWEVRDASGTLIGRVGGMAVDTERRVVDTIILEDGTRFRSEDVSIDDGVVYVSTYGAPRDVAARPYTDRHAVRPARAAVAAERAEGHREIAEERAEMRREIRAEGREAADAANEASGYSALEGGFQSHFGEAYRDDDLDYTDYSPAYRYGYDAAYDDRYAGRAFADAESDLREAYYRRFGYPMSDNIVWSRIRKAVHHAFENAHSGLR